MKKLLFVVAALVLVTSSYAQTVIPRVGVTLSTWGGDDAEAYGDAKSKLGFTLGAGFNMPLGEGPISLQPELNFIKKGVKFEGEDWTETYSLSYLEVPVLVKATFGEATKFYVNAGPSVGFGLGGKLKWEEGDEDGDEDIKFGDGDDEDVTYVEKKTDIGLQLGGGVILGDKIIIDIRYGLGLTDLYEDASVKNNGFQFTVGYPIKLK